MSHIKSSILLIYTGGTIGMKEDIKEQTLKPFDFKQILKEVPEIQKFALKADAHSFEPLIDSSDVEPSFWVKLAELIKNKYDDYDGFIILHGTDTMAYSASALSFMLDGLTKPIIFTGSQLPIGAPRTDGRENLLLAVEVAAKKDREGHSMIPEVCICFDSLILRGNRSTKVSSDTFRAFKSPNFPQLAEAGISIKYNTEYIRKPIDWYQNISINSELDTRVGILKLYPGITEQAVKSVLDNPYYRAVIIESYGSGNAPMKKWFLDAVSEASGGGKILLNVSQCLRGNVDMSIYANGKALEKCGVINGYDLTMESAITKLFYLMGKTKFNDRVKEMMTQSLKGEMSK